MRIIKAIKSRIKVLLNKDVLFPENEKLKEIFDPYNKAYILGSAPSINKIDFNKLDKEAVMISMGNFHEHPDIETINPQVHIFAASHPPITEKVLKKWFARAEERLPPRTVVLVEEKDYEVAKSIFKSRKLYRYAYGGDFPIDFTKKIISPTTVAMVAIQLGYYIGLEELNLLGIDHDWQNTGGYFHFYDHNKPSLELYLKQDGLIDEAPAFTRRQPKERLYRFYYTYKLYESLQIKEKNRKFEIYNADPYSGFDAFEKKAL
ncbi:hypothetical protein [Winogradskyella sp.]|uniref:hypothetical protein n=1 Tax=Winogradskyella sp. TaxID=1883156 RepID=UPI003BAD703D